eukprot:GEMP01006574.1.p1 GENE.GEMP01006574.1~~GEMP01006574.1.p1  ORF type:complete len:646 (+),score=152.77 GEMP01006574.1:247-2184(+)
MTSAEASVPSALLSEKFKRESRLLDDPRYVFSRTPSFPRSPLDDNCFRPNVRADVTGRARSPAPVGAYYGPPGPVHNVEARWGGSRPSPTLSSSVTRPNDTSSLELRGLRAELVCVNAQNVDLIRDLDATRSEKLLMRDEVARLTDRMRVLEIDTKHQHRDSPLKYTELANEHAAHVAQLTQERDEARRKHILEETGRLNAEQRVRTLEEQKYILEEQKRTLEAQRVPDELRKQRLEDELRGSDQLLKEMRITCDAYENQVRKEQQKVQELQAEGTKTFTEVEALERQKNHFFEESNRLQAVLSNERQETSGYMDEQASLRRAARSREEEIKAEIDALIDKNKGTSEELAEARKQIKELEKQCDAQAQSVKLYEEKVSELDRIRNELTLKLQQSEHNARRSEFEARLDSEIQRIHLRHNDAVAEIDRVRHESRDLRRVNREMDSELQQCGRQSDAATRRFNSQHNGDVVLRAMPRQSEGGSLRRSVQNGDIGTTSSPTGSSSVRRTQQKMMMMYDDPVKALHGRTSLVDPTERKTSRNTNLVGRFTDPGRSVERPHLSLKARSQSCAMRPRRKVDNLQTWKSKALIAIQGLQSEVCDLQDKYQAQLEYSQQLRMKMDNLGKISEAAMQNCEMMSIEGANDAVPQD